MGEVGLKGPGEGSFAFYGAGTLSRGLDRDLSRKTIASACIWLANLCGDCFAGEVKSPPLPHFDNINTSRYDRGQLIQESGPIWIG